MQKESSRTVVREKVKPNIWRRKNAQGKWVYEITYKDSDGRDRRQTVHGGGLKGAETALAKVKARMGDGERVAPQPRLTFAVASTEWMTAKSPNLTPKTISTYRYGLDIHLLPAFGSKRLSEVDVTAVAKFIARMQTAEYRRVVQQRTGQMPDASEGYSAQTIKSVLIPLSRTMAYAKRHLGFAGENPVTALDNDERPGYGQRKAQKRKLNREELDKLIDAATSPWREIIATAAALGTRMGETLGLEWRHIDFEAGLISIQQQANSKREIARVKTATAVRRIEAPDWLLSMLRELKVASKFSGYEQLVFCTSTGRPHNHGNVLARGLYPALSRAGIPQTSFHSLRHTHASLWIKDGGDVITLSKRLGHSNPQITMTTYAAEIEETNDNSVRKARVNALFDGTQMAARMAATDGHSPSHPDTETGADVLRFPQADNEPPQAATA